MDKVKPRPKIKGYRISIFLIFILIILTNCYYQESKINNNSPTLLLGNEVLLKKHINKLKGKKIALVINHTSQVSGKLLVDTLLSLGIKITKIFTPEHGFLGKEDAGKLINEVDYYKNIPIISLYGKNKKPTSEHLKDVELIIFDIQDVGVRFYTYISTLAYVMEAAAENNITVFVLDRPNPNSYYVGGPVLDTSKYKSFVGLFPIPVVYGLTIGELAKMINEEKWIKKSCNLTIIPMENYERKPFISRKWIAPSPNLKTDTSAFLYPALCFFEGTSVSVGRGTASPFQLVGSPYHLQFRKYYYKNVAMTKYGFLLKPIIFVPNSMEGASNPKYKGDTCYGVKIMPTNEAIRNPDNVFLLSFALLKSFYNEWKEYQKINNKKLPPYFNSYFEKLTGTDSIRYYIINGLDETLILNKIKNSTEFQEYLYLRKKYLIYK